MKRVLTNSGRCTNRQRLFGPDPSRGRSALEFCPQADLFPLIAVRSSFDAIPIHVWTPYVTVILQTNESVSNSFRLEGGQHGALARNFFDTQRCWRAMNATLTKQFEGFAECCLELARSAETTERRARFIQMADEYRLATLLTSEELSSGPKSRRLLPAAESPLLIAAEAPASRALTRPQPRLFARSAAPRHPGFKAQMFDADKQNRDLSNRDQGGNAEGPDT